MAWLWVALGAAVGAPLRFLVDRIVQARHSTGLPAGTFAVNMIGSFILGLLTTLTPVLAAGSTLAAVLGTGFCGALTTYSTFSYESFALLERSRRAAATLNLAGSVIVGLTAALLGLLTGTALT